jgi:hypothetical protein
MPRQALPTLRTPSPIRPGRLAIVLAAALLAYVVPAAWVLEDPPGAIDKSGGGV